MADRKNLVETFKDLTNRIEKTTNPESKYFRGFLTSLAAGEWNPDFVEEYNSEKPINEGIFKTYSVDKTIEYVKNLFGLDDNNIVKIGGHGANSMDTNKILVRISNTPENNKAIDRVMGLCGWFRNNEVVVGDYIEISYGARHEGVDITDKVHEMNRIIHITPAYNVRKIKKNGLVPKSKNSRFNYPDRIYFFKGDTPFIEIGYQILDFAKHNNTGGDNSKYAIVYVGTSELPDNCRFFYDSSYSYGIWTSDNIPPSCIRDIKIIDISDLKSFYSGRLGFFGV